MSEAQQATNSLYHIAPTHPTQPADVSHLRLVPCPVHNLPVQLSSFIGRSHELVEVTDMLASARLLTLTGSGGCGKTRLALQAATDLLTTFSDGVWWIELAALADESLLPQTVARALGVHEQLGRPLVETIADHLQAKRQLLILDNCEHLVVACAALADTLLRTCPHLQVMATSREALRISGETVWRVPPLALPQHDPTRNTTSAYASSAQSGTIALLRSAVPSTTASDNWQLLAQAEAVQLFVARAAAILPAFRLTCQNAPVVAQICRRLDGIPLAIELAAARVNVLPVEQLAVRLDEDFRVLTAGSRTALPRHQTLRAAIE
ncbi:MAG TPA: NB-ARC domain-containing protein [Roseiflexaceae bacterium]|nr:NB-ARC domain-containing protein [Roseiflexaceae bacterium]